jgi:N-acetylmuramoyl-L-alanine amidase
MEKKRLVLFFTALLIFIFLEERHSSAKSDIIQIGVDNANVRSEPAMTASVIGSAKRNEQFQVLKEKYDWYQIQLSGGKKGWVASYIGTKSSGNSPVPVNSGPSIQTGTITADRVNIRNSPSLSASIIGKVNTGDQVDIVSITKGWVRIRYQYETAWVSSQFVRSQSAQSNSSQNTSSTDDFVIITNGGTNIRTSPSTSSSVIVKGTPGERYPITGREGEWYKISLVNGNEAYVASWVVSSSNDKTSSAKNSNSLNGKVIVLDPGHGGIDGGTTGTQGTIEKNVTLKTAERLAKKLQQEGATVVMTRSTDTYVPLPSRTDHAHYHNADAFISIHYDGAHEKSAAGFTTYYYHQSQKQLANSINNGLSNSMSAKNRGMRNGDYFVLRENNQPAILLELGYLTNSYEASSIVTESYQQLATNGIYNGLLSYFSN